MGPTYFRVYDLLGRAREDLAQDGRVCVAPQQRPQRLEQPFERGVRHPYEIACLLFWP